MANEQKKKMRTAGVLLCGVVLAVVPMMAQQDAPPPPPEGQMQGPPPGGPGGMDPARRLQMLQKQLKLTPEQTAQVKGILDESKGKMEELRENTAISPDERWPKMMEIMKKENDKIKAILTDEQKTKFEAMEERMRERRGGDGSTPPEPPPM